MTCHTGEFSPFTTSQAGWIRYMTPRRDTTYQSHCKAGEGITTLVDDAVPCCPPAIACFSTVSLLSADTNQLAQTALRH